MNKVSLIAAMVLGGVVACSTLANAQDAPKKKGRFTVEQQMERVTTELNLTDEQKPKVKAVLEESSKKMREIFSDQSLDQSQRREKMQPILEEQNKKMKAILTADQFKKYEELNARGKKGGKKGGKKAEKKAAE